MCDNRQSPIGGGSEAAELGGSTDGTEMTSAWTAMDPTNAKTRARIPIGKAAKACFGGRAGGPDDDVAPGRDLPPWPSGYPDKARERCKPLLVDRQNPVLARVQLFVGCLRFDHPQVTFPPKPALSRQGPDGSNPSPSSGESAANLRPAASGKRFRASHPVSLRHHTRNPPRPFAPIASATWRGTR